VTSGMIVRQAAPQDAQAAGDLAVRAWRRIYERRRELLGAELFDRVYPDWPGFKRGQVVEHLRQHPERALVTEIDGRMAGFITWWFWPGGAVGEIGNNAVDPEFGGRGVGSAQCRKALEVFAAQGCQVAAVSTGLDEAHAPARRMYEKVGFGPSYPAVTYFQRLGGKENAGGA